MVELDDLSNDLDRSEKLMVTAEELKYRAALRTAMDILKSVSTIVPKNIKDLTDDTSSPNPEVHDEVVKRAGIRTSPRKKFQEKGTLNRPTVVNDRSNKYLITDSAAKPTKCHEDLDAKNELPDKPEVVKQKELKDTSDRKNRKRTKDRGAEQDSASCKKSRTPKTLSHCSITTEEHMPEKKTDTYRFKKSKGTRNGLKNSLFTESEKLLVTSPEKDNAVKDKSSGQDQHSCEQKNKSRIVSHSSPSTDEYKSGKSKGTKNRNGRCLFTKNVRHCILTPEPVTRDRKKAKTSRQDMLCHEQTFKPRTVSSSSTTTDQPRSEKCKGTVNKFKCLTTENKERCIMLSDPDEDDTGKAKQLYRPQKSGTKRKGSVQAATQVLEGGTTDVEKDAQTKGKFNQLPLPDFTFSGETGNRVID